MRIFKSFLSLPFSSPLLHFPPPFFFLLPCPALLTNCVFIGKLTKGNKTNNRGGWGVPILWFCRIFGAFRAVQGWPSVIPRFSAVDFLSYYIELLVMALMYTLWLVVHRVVLRPPLAAQQPTSSPTTAVEVTTTYPAARPFFDFVDLSRVDLYHDEHEDAPVDKHEHDVRACRLRGPAGWAWALYYYIVA